MRAFKYAHWLKLCTRSHWHWTKQLPYLTLKTTSQCLSKGYLAFTSLCLCVPIVFSSASLSYAAGEPAISGLNFQECTIGNGTAQLIAQCATISVPIDYEDTTKESKLATQSSSTDSALATKNTSLVLSIARIPARRQSDKTDAVTLLAGGPGQSAIDSFPMLAFAFRHMMRDRDIILVDQRGTGDSAKLSCPDSPDTLGLESDIDTQELAQLASQCHDSLPYDPQFFTTSVAVKDLELIRQQLGVSQWNLYGISYGTRVALHYLRRYPESVRTIALDAVVPPSIALGPEIAPLAQRALDLIFERCSNDEGCHSAFGNLKQPTLALLDSLDANPRSITYEDIASGKLSVMEFTRDHLAITLRLMSYSSQTAAILPSMLHDAIVNGNFAPLARQANLQTQSLGDTLATGMHHAVVCTEDAPFIEQASIDAPAAGYMGEDIVDSLLATCQNWPSGVLDDDFKQPVKATTPALVLSGGADPITPPEYGESVVQHLSASRHIVNVDQAHMQAPFGCMPVLLAQFVEQADAVSLDTSCLERYHTQPFFVDANGPLP